MSVWSKILSQGMNLMMTQYDCSWMWVEGQTWVVRRWEWKACAESAELNSRSMALWSVNLSVWMIISGWGWGKSVLVVCSFMNLLRLSHSWRVEGLSLSLGALGSVGLNVM